MIGRQIGDYLIQDRLGAGGMGEVYKALELKLNRVVALKLLSEKLAGDEAFVARFMREAELAAKLSHPNIATVFAAGISGGVRFLAMEYLPGETLAARLRR